MIRIWAELRRERREVKRERERGSLEILPRPAILGSVPVPFFHIPLQQYPVVMATYREQAYTGFSASNDANLFALTR